jgi:hypothetical protein
VPCPEWWSDAETDTAKRHWCYVNKDDEYVEADVEEDEEPAEDDGFLMAKLRQEEDEVDAEPEDIEDPGNEDESSIIDLGHVWDFEWMYHYFNWSLPTKENVEDFTWENIEARRESVEANPFQGPDGDPREIMADELNDMRDNFGLYSFWDTTWDISVQMLGVMYNYQQGYYYYYLGHAMGSLLADIAIIFQWWFIYSPLQARRADAVNEYIEAYWRAADAEEGGAEDEDASEDAEDAENEEEFI